MWAIDAERRAGACATSRGHETMCPLGASRRNRDVPLGPRGSAQTGGIRPAGDRTVRQPRSARTVNRPSRRGVELAARPFHPATASVGKAFAAPLRRQVRAGAGSSFAGPSCAHLLSW
jgi:hypothetical protein